MSVTQASTRAIRNLFERLPDDARQAIQRNWAMVRGLDQLKRNQAMLALRVAGLEADGPASPLSERVVVDDRFPQGLTSRICNEAQLREPWFAPWCAALGELPRANRKLWEHAYLAHALDMLGQLQPGHRGLGFGVGREPLVALFAGRGCEIVATDLAPQAEEARGWSNTDQHAGGLDGLLRADLCDTSRFRELASWRAADMRSLPSDLTQFDFCWSACSLEHLGTLEAGLHFVEQSIRSLRPGGVAVHTTEYNLTSNSETVSAGRTVLYRRRDLENLVERLEGAGHQVAALDLAPGQGVLDQYVDLPPYVEEPRLRLWFGKFTTTSIALIIRAKPSVT